MKRTLAGLCGIALACIGLLRGQNESDGRGGQFSDPLLDHLLGDWHVIRRFGSGRTVENMVHVEWVLNHQFLQLHYLDLAEPPHYEAMVFIGYDTAQHHYICHWLDSLGGGFSALGDGQRDAAGQSIEFTFNYPEGKLTNRFSFDPAAQTWTSLMRQQEKAQWKLFAEDKFTPSIKK